jgi:hypothetical protein
MIDLNKIITSMKKIIGFGFIGVVLLAILFISGFINSKEEKMRHIVIFKFKPNATDQQIEEVTEAFGDLKNKIPGIIDFEHGINDSPENKNMGFTHVYMLTFEDAEARDNYLPHPEHKKFGELLGELGILEDAFVVDFSPEKK